MKRLKLIGLALGMASSAQGAYITQASSQYIGFIDAGNVGDAGRTNLVNQLIALAPGATAVPSVAPTAGNLLTRSLNLFASLPAATGITNQNGVQGSVAGQSIYTSLNFTYMYAKYDGPNYGTVVYNIAGLSSVEIAATAGGYGLSGVSFFTPSTTPPPPPPPGVPDGGPTLALLGLALSGLGIARRAASKD